MKSFVFPGNLDQEILNLSASQLPYMRTPWFSKLVLDSESMLLDLIDCPNGKVIPFTASGTAAMESCVLSFAKSHQKVLTINGGSFGQRWSDLCEYHNVEYDEFPVPFGKNPNMESLKNRLYTGHYQTLLMQHHETASGNLYDIETIAGWCKSNGVWLVVDAISSFLTDNFSMKDFGVDIAVLSSQKGLNIQPGLSMVILSPQVLEQKESFARSAFYYDWQTNLDNLLRGQTPYSPATQLFMQLHMRLKQVTTLGVNEVIRQTAARAHAFRNECVKNNWTFVAETPSNCITGIRLPYDVKATIHYLNEREIYVMPSKYENMIRVAHTGVLTPENDIELAEELKKWENQKP